MLKIIRWLFFAFLLLNSSIWISLDALNSWMKEKKKKVFFRMLNEIEKKYQKMNF